MAVFAGTAGRAGAGRPGSTRRDEGVVAIILLWCGARWSRWWVASRWWVVRLGNGLEGEDRLLQMVFSVNATRSMRLDATYARYNCRFSASAAAGAFSALGARWVLRGHRSTKWSGAGKVQCACA